MEYERFVRIDKLFLNFRANICIAFGNLTEFAPFVNVRNKIDSMEKLDEAMLLLRTIQ